MRMRGRRWPAARRSLMLLWCAAIGIAARSQAMSRLVLRGGGNAGNEVGAGLSPDRVGGTAHAPDQAQSGPGRVSLRVVEVRPTHEELRVPDHVESIKEAVGLALDGQTIYVRAGEHRWRGEMVFARNTTFFVRGELGSRLWGQWQRRLVQPRAGTDNYCVCLPFGSQGSLGSLVLAHDTLGSFDACLHVSGGPWLLGQCKVLSNHATALLANGAADLLVRRCSLGGLEPAECVDEQVFGDNLARYGLYAVGNASISLQACVIENTGRTGGIGARFASSAAGVLLGCMLRCNDIALSLDDRARVAVRGTTVQVALALPCVVQPCVTLLPACPNLTRGQQRNAWSAWHVGYRCFTCQLDLSDNTVIGREWFNIRRPGQRIPRYHSCCNGRGCTNCVFSVDSMEPSKAVIERSRYMNGRAAEHEEDMPTGDEDADYGGNTTRLIVTFNQDTNEIELEKQVFPEEDRAEALAIPDNVTGPAFLWRINKPGPLNETRLGTVGLVAVAKWWDRMNSAYI